MAILAGGRELGGNVVRICRLVISLRMAAKARVRGGVVIACMARKAVFRNQGMGPGQQVIIIVYGKASRYPLGLGGMAKLTVVGNAQGHMVGVHSLVKLWCMAAGTFVGGIDIIAGMAIETVVQDGSMGPGKGVIFVVVVEQCRKPVGCGGMA